MRNAVRKVASADRAKTIGYGVFPGWQVANVLEQATIDIKHCTDPDDERSCRDQGKTYRLKSLHPTLEQAGAKARRLNTQKWK